jgi:hypothetical protein
MESGVVLAVEPAAKEVPDAFGLKEPAPVTFPASPGYLHFPNQ